jgi:transposase
MALGKRKDEQQELWIATTDLPKSSGHPFYKALNRLLAEADFDRFAEALCEPYYAQGVGRPGIPPGVYFRMLMVGYFEGIGSQRGIAWRCSDSLSLRAFLGVGPIGSTPDHSSLTVIRKRLPLDVHEQVFAKVLAIAQARHLLDGKTVAMDTTTLEANAAMKSIVRKDSGDDWKAYLRRLAQEAGIENPTDAELRRFDKRRKGKKVSNQDWQSPTDPDSRIAKMKDGRTHLAYKADHAIDLESQLLLSATIHPGDRGDPDILQESLITAQANLLLAGNGTAVSEVVADSGYHKAETLAWCGGWGVRTYIPERDGRGRRWQDKPPEWKTAVYANRRRVKGTRSKGLQRRRSECVERSFAHTCEAGGGRRTWLRGFENVSKRYLIHAASHNLGLILRAAFGVGTPRSLQGSRGLAHLLHLLIRLLWTHRRSLTMPLATRIADQRRSPRYPSFTLRAA